VKRATKRHERNLKRNRDAVVERCRAVVINLFAEGSLIQPYDFVREPQ